MSEAFDQTTEEIFSFLQQYIRQHGYAPSFNEIEENCHISRGTVVRHLDRLEMQNRVIHAPGKARSIRITNSNPKK